jgi:hypothetical protein
MNNAAVAPDQEAGLAGLNVRQFARHLATLLTL